MKRNWIKLCALALAFPLLLCSSCKFPPVGGNTNDGTNGNGENFSMLARVENLDNPFQVEVIEAEYASGPYWLVTSSDTVYEDKEGNRIAKSNLKIGDTVRVYYNGQVMMSFPPQVVARRIVKQ